MENPNLYVIKGFDTKEMLAATQVRILLNAKNGRAIEHPRAIMELPIIFSMDAMKSVYSQVLSAAGIDQLEHRELVRKNNRIEITIDAGKYLPMLDSIRLRSCYGADEGWLAHYLNVVETGDGALHLYCKYQSILGGWKLGVLDRKVFVSGLAEMLKIARLG